MNDLGHLCKHSGINEVSFCQITHGSGKITGLSGAES